MFYTYIVECADGTYYTCWTTDIRARVAVHNKGNGARYTRSRLPVTLIYYELHPSESQARKREYAIKQLSRAAKETLVAGFSGAGGSTVQ
jgi:putative endonuclease